MWKSHLRHDPIVFLQSSHDPVLLFWTKQLSQAQHEDPSSFLWHLPVVEKIFKKQQSDGSWLYRGNRPGDAYGEKYELLETWRTLNNLVERYGFDRRHTPIEKGCEYILSYQTEEGDIRGILSNQYTPYYMGVMLETLIKAGFGHDPRVIIAIKWLESQQQEGGGWIIPMMMFKMSEYKDLCQRDPIPPDRTLDFSHVATGMVIRAFAVHPDYQQSSTAKNTGGLLKQRFFKRDSFTSRQGVSYWFKLQFPFWWTNLLTSLDSLQRIGFKKHDADIKQGLDWFLTNQNENGGWSSSYSNKNDANSDEWVTLAVCRVLKGFLNS